MCVAFVHYPINHVPMRFLISIFHTIKVPVCDHYKYMIKSPIQFVYVCVCRNTISKLNVFES